jgi:anaerobic magnesium-protoporphyrin IX monomethyl ester cyclase
MIKKVLIVIPPLINVEDGKTDFQGPEFEIYRLVSPIEPMSVAASLLESGFDVSVFDMGLYKDRIDSLYEHMCDFPPDAVVLVSSIMTFATAQDWDGAKVFRMARSRRENVVRILTGPHATNYPGQAVMDDVCDYSIKGEVDFEVRNLLVRLNEDADISRMPGLAYRHNGSKVEISTIYPSVDVAKLPLPAYQILDDDEKQRYADTLEYGKIRFPEKSPFYRDIMTSRSCVLRCSFCSVAHLRGETQKYRRKPLDMVMAEIEQALEQGIKEIHFFDDLFAENEEQIFAFTDELVRRNLKFDWFPSQGMPLWPLTKDALTAMKETGMYRIICPLESGSNSVLDRVVGKKYSTIEHHHDVLQWATELGMEIIGMFVVGMPGETRSEILDTIHFAEEHPEIDYSVFSIATPMVGTKLMRQVVKDGQLTDEDSINRIIKRTVALYHTEEFSEYELGVIRAFDWGHINFATEGRRQKYARMVGITMDQLDEMRAHSVHTFEQYFPDFNGPYSFKELYHQAGLYREMEPVMPASLY